MAIKGLSVALQLSKFGRRRIQNAKEINYKLKQSQNRTSEAETVIHSDFSDPAYLNWQPKNALNAT